MKRFITAILLMLLQLCLCPSALAVEPVDDFFPADMPSSVTSAQIVEETLYVLGDGKIMAFAQPQTEASVVIELDVYPEIAQAEWEELFLISDGTRLYLLNPGRGQLYLVRDHELELLVRLDISSLGTETDEVESRYVIFSSPVIMDRSLYLLSMDPVAFQSYELCRFSLDTGAYTSVGLGALELDEIAPYKNGRLMAVDRNTGNLLALTPDGSGNADVIVQLPNSSDRYAAYDEANDAYYFLSGSTLMRYRNGFETVENVLPYETSLGLWYGRLIVKTSLGLYQCGPDGEKSQKNSLKIWTGSELALSELIVKFRAAYPDISVEVQTVQTDDPMERLMNESLSRDASIDLFVLSSHMINGQEIFSRGFAAPIQSELLQKNVQAMYPQVQALMTQNGTLYGYPLALYPDFWSVRPELLRESGMGDAAQTMEEYVDMLLLWYETYADADPGYTFNGSSAVRTQQVQTAFMLLCEYILNHAEDDAPISFRTPEIYRLMEKLASLSAYEGSVLDSLDDEVIGEYARIFQTGYAVLPFYRGINPSAQGEICIPAPVFARDGLPVSSGSLDYFIINPNSSQMEAAAAFLEFFSQNIDMAASYILYPGQNDPIENENYQEEVAECQETIERITDSIQRYEKMIGVQSDMLQDFPEDSDDYLKQQEDLARNQETLTELKDSLAEKNASLAEIMEKRYVYSAQDIAEYRDAAQYMRLDGGWLIWSIAEGLDIESILEKYFEGFLSLDQMLSEIDQKAAMMFYEGQ